MHQSIVQTLDQYVYVYKAVLNLVENVKKIVTNPNQRITARGMAGLEEAFDELKAFRATAQSLSRDRARALTMMMVCLPKAALYKSSTVVSKRTKHSCCVDRSCTSDNSLSGCP